MPHIIETTVYEFEELSPQAQEKARDWYRQCIDETDYAATIEDFVEVARILGVTTTYKQVYWSGFSSQGDGASFEGIYQGPPGNIREYAPKDTELHRIADGLAAFPPLFATIRHEGRYCHEGCMKIAVTEELEPEAEAQIIELLRDLARWLYRQLSKENDYLMSEENVDEAITANEYTFTAEGKRFG